MYEISYEIGNRGVFTSDMKRRLVIVGLFVVLAAVLVTANRNRNPGRTPTSRTQSIIVVTQEGRMTVEQQPDERRSMMFVAHMPGPSTNAPSPRTNTSGK